MIDKPKTCIEDLFKNPSNGQYLKVVAPMVRYSRLEFRSLVRRYDADLTFSPMTIANSFCRSERCRQHEFTTNIEDTPMIVQFAANCSTDFLHATEMIVRYADGVDLNCGCPQSWAMQDGYGSYLLRKPEIIEDMIKTVRRNIPSSFSVSIKIRLLNKDLSSTIDFCRKLETLNPTFITIHGRTPNEKSSAEFPVDIDALAEIKKSIKLPIIFNGDVSSITEADKFYNATKCDGMMSARAVLANPALFAGHQQTPLSCVQDWINIHNRQGDKMTFQNFHHHLVFMMENLLTKLERNKFNEFTKKHQCLEFLAEKFSITPQPIDYPNNFSCTYDDTNYKNLVNQKDFWTSNYSTESSHGKFFLNKLNKVRQDPDVDYLEFMDNKLFS
ncbi:CLUMA_CG019118, isoform A [Clunio marinus]|uniref:CLUMA_CG019118, isoform A n=1 Tax=Clunio marinus TaxID=568069 RepID=A0A1J1J092_9DIPT|nr:CLUMA_CG019118, isoform A [Clunio marinus]